MNTDMTWTEVIKYAETGSPEPERRVVKSDEEWRRILPDDVYMIARMKGTERPFTGEYCEAHEPGTYACVCCGTVLFDSERKFESGTGWPSFTKPASENVIKYANDRTYGMHRVEVMCNVCDGHLGHVFPDGPPPSGLRYCVNSASIKKI